MNYRFLVCVRCFTFNHAPYITDALNGFTMQQTNFPFVCTIVDDASTDNEVEIIKEYLDNNFDLEDKSVVRKEETDDYVLIYARHKENRNCYFAVFFLKYNHHSIKKSKMSYISEWRDHVKYNAFCEGDDYWINPQKLQKQIDILESHSEYGMCFTDFNLEDTVNGKNYYAQFNSNRTKFPIVYDLRQWITNYYYAAPMTWIVRHELLAKIPKIKSSDGTYVWYAFFLWFSKVYCLNDVTAVYRRISDSASNTLNPSKLYLREEGMYNAKKMMIENFMPKEEQSEVRRIVDEIYYSLCLKLMVALGKYEQLDVASNVLSGGNSLMQKFLLSYPRNKYATSVFRFFYVKYISLRKRILNKI